MNTEENVVIDLNDFRDFGLEKEEPEDTVVVNSIVTKSPVDYLDDPAILATEPIEDKVIEETILNKDEAKQVIDSLAQEPLEESVVVEDQPKKGKEALIDFMADNIESGDYLNYSDYKDGEDLKAYLSKLPIEDLKNLHKENLTRIRREESAKGPEEFIQSLDPKIQAAIYYSQLGQDPTPYIQAQYQLDNIKNADLEQESVQEQIVKTHLTNTQFGTPEEIDAEVRSFKELGQLENRAKKFHPHLVKQDEQRIQKLEQQAQYEEQQRNLQYQQYVEGVHSALKAGELAGIKLDRKTQESLYVGMITPQYPDRFGQPTTELGSLLDKIQFTEPNYSLLAEVTMFLRNPDDYREKIRQQGANKNTQETVRTLKTEQSRQLQPNEQTPSQTAVQRPGIPRKNGFFTRPNSSQ